MFVEYLKKVQTAIDFIEDNLHNELTLNEIAYKVHFSMHHFHRIFHSFVGESLTEYIRRRRLTKAAHLLRNTQSRILDIAFVSGFNSQEAFTRAFQNMFDITPGQYRNQKQRLLLKEKPRITLSLLVQLEGGLQMHTRIVEKDAMTVIGLPCLTTLKENKIPQLWNKFNQRKQEIKQRVDQHIVMGISEFSSNPYDNPFTYLACVPVKEVLDIPKGMVTKTIPSMKYVVTTHKGRLDTLGDTFDYIYAIWLPKSDYELAEAHDFEIYDERFLGPDHEQSEVDVYIPIIKNSE
jgi:AraC family transcriptional regulator